MIVLAIHMFSSLPLTSVHCTKCGGMRRWALPIWNVMERQDTTLSADIWIQILYDSSSIWYGEHKTNVYVRDGVNSHAGHEKPLLSAVKRWNLARFRSLAHLEPPPLFFFTPETSRKSLHGTGEGGRRRGMQRKSGTLALKSGQGVVFHTNLCCCEQIVEVESDHRWFHQEIPTTHDQDYRMR